MNQIKNLTEEIVAFRDARDWKKFHNPKDMALSLVLEATEVMEHFQWKDLDETSTYVEKNRNEIAEELADVFYWILLMSSDLNIDIAKSLDRKLKINNEKYPVEKSKGVATKYDKL